MNFATWSLRNPIPAILLFALLSLAGVMGFRHLPVQNMPDVDRPTLIIVLKQPGAAPTQLETEVARKVENSLSTVMGLQHMRTSITDGQVQIRAEFLLEKKLSEALVDARDAVDRIRTELPTDLEEPTISGITVSGGAVVSYAVGAEGMNEENLSWFVDDVLDKALMAVPGVGRVDRLGGVDREVRVEIDPVRLAGQGVTAGDISRALKRTQLESSGGRGQLGQAEQSVRTIGTLRQASELAALPIALPNGRSVRLDQVASIRDIAADRTQTALLDGRPVVGFSVFRSRNVDETRVAAGVEAALARLQAATPTLKATPISGSVAYTAEQYRGSMQMLYEGAILAVIVVWCFLRDWRATLVAASALPLSILPTFAAMAWLGYSLNTLTLLALAVIVGILVDDAIVEVENIERHRRMGKPVLQATSDAVNEIALAVVATTMTLVVVFVPTALMGGIPGLFFKQFGWTAVIAILASLLVARLITPIMAKWLLRANAGHAQEEADGRLMQRYLRAVRWCLTHRKTTLIAAAAFFAGSIAMIPFIPSGLMPAADRGYTTVTVELAPGSPLKSTLAVAEDVRKALNDVAGIQRVFTSAGAKESGGDRQAGDVRRGTMTLVLSPRDERRPQADIERDVRSVLTRVPGARFTVGSGGMGEKLSLILASDNAQALKASAQAFERELRGVAGLSSVRSTASLERPEIIVRPDAQRAAERGVSTMAIGEMVRIATTGDFDAQLSKLNLDNRQVPIRVRVPDESRRDLDALAALRVAGREGLVPLSTVAKLSLESGPAQIDRYDRQRYVTVEADLGLIPLGDATRAARALPAISQLPSNVFLLETGDGEIAAELASGFGVAILTGVLCMFCVLALLFKDFLQPFTILSAVPLSIGGAFVALMLARSELDVPSLIGLVMLMGISTKNSILLVEYVIVSVRDRGLALDAALIDACHKRARPIVMTTIAMIAGMLPIALGLGADASFRQPMAVAVIGGLLSSTLLSLLVVPVVFACVDGMARGLVEFAVPRSDAPIARAEGLAAERGE